MLYSAGRPYASIPLGHHKSTSAADAVNVAVKTPSLPAASLTGILATVDRSPVAPAGALPQAPATINVPDAPDLDDKNTFTSTVNPPCAPVARGVVGYAPL